MGRPIGNRMQLIMSTLQHLGPSGARTVCKEMYNGDINGCSKYLCSAEERGWLTVAIVNYKKVYTAVPGWETHLLNAPGHGFMPLAKFRPPPEHELQKCWRVCDDTT